MPELDFGFTAPTASQIDFMLDFAGDMSPYALRRLRETHRGVSEDRQRRVYDELASRLDAGGFANLSEVPTDRLPDILQYRDRDAGDWARLWAQEDSLLRRFAGWDSSELRLGAIYAREDRPMVERLADEFDHYGFANLTDVPREMFELVAL